MFNYMMKLFSIDLESEKLFSKVGLKLKETIECKQELKVLCDAYVLDRWGTSKWPELEPTPIFLSNNQPDRDQTPIQQIRNYHGN